MEFSEYSDSITELISADSSCQDSVSAVGEKSSSKRGRKELALTDTQKNFIKTRFIRLGYCKILCTYCFQVIPNEHVSRWASHFRACCKVPYSHRSYYDRSCKEFQESLTMFDTNVNQVSPIDLILLASHQMDLDSSLKAIEKEKTLNAISNEVPLHMESSYSSAANSINMNSYPEKIKKKRNSSSANTEIPIDIPIDIPNDILLPAESSSWLPDSSYLNNYLETIKKARNLSSSNNTAPFDIETTLSSAADNTTQMNSNPKNAKKKKMT